MSNTPLNSLALLVVDMQDGFIKAVPNGEIIVSRCAFAIEAAQLFGIRTYFTTQAPEKLGDVTPRLLELVDDPVVFPKTAFSAFNAPGLEQKLTEEKIDHLIIAGIETTICVYQTAIAAIGEEFDVTLFSDCISGRREEDRVPTLNALAASGCHILPSEAVFYSILGDAVDPLFRDFTQLVKKYNSA